MLKKNEDKGAPIVAFENSEKSEILCSVCGEDIGNLCSNCNLNFNEILEIASLNAHGTNHNRQLIELLKSQTDNHEELDIHGNNIPEKRFQTTIEDLSFRASLERLSAESPLST